jgi:hypothetical protein
MIEDEEEENMALMKRKKRVTFNYVASLRNDETEEEFNGKKQNRTMMVKDLPMEKIRLGEKIEEEDEEE